MQETKFHDGESRYASDQLILHAISWPSRWIGSIHDLTTSGLWSARVPQQTSNQTLVTLLEPTTCSTVYLFFGFWVIYLSSKIISLLEILTCIIRSGHFLTHVIEHGDITCLGKSAPCSASWTQGPDNRAIKGWNSVRSCIWVRHLPMCDSRPKVHPILISQVGKRNYRINIGIINLESGKS
jgi:hypothetical protein